MKVSIAQGDGGRPWHTHSSRWIFVLSLTPPLQSEVRALAWRSDELFCTRTMSLLALPKLCACNDILGMILVNGGMFGAEEREVVKRCLRFSSQR